MAKYENVTVCGDSSTDVCRLDDGGPWKGDRQFVIALARGLELIRSFHPNERYLGVTELSHRIGIPKPSVARLAGTLVKLGYLEFSAARGKYSLGLGVLSLGYAMLSNVGIRRVARPLLKELATYSQAAVSIGERDRLSMVYIETVRSEAPIGLRRGIGARLPIATTSMGRAYLAGLPEEERSELIDQMRQTTQTNWPRLQAGIEQGLNDYAKWGFCTSFGEWEKDVNAVAVPFVDGDGTRMAFSCGGAAFLLSREKLEKDIGPRLAYLVRCINGGNHL
ncbi:MAG: IclR family transcriptional regulator [Azoarcus sp.]|jgi:DNA-binding IclR family transcriptional regulator|nr:IclR family transcriptional regulator [Azoarcus sp.]